MPQWVGREAIRAARKTNLYDFLESQHPSEVRREGDSLRLRRNNSVSIRRGYSGYTDFATSETGNAIECLTRHLGYDFQGAVAALCEYMCVSADTEQPRTAPKPVQEPLQDPPRVFVPPEPSQGQYRRLYAYLVQQRGIPAAMIQQLIDWGLLYQERVHNNIVFINPAKDFAELRGTNSYKPFHQVMFSDPAAYWYFMPDGPDSAATVAFICEAAIDAVSLFLLHRAAGLHDGENGLYCSIGGVANQQRIDRIKSGMSSVGCQTVLAVDNDAAGEKCRQRNPDCFTLVPRLRKTHYNAIQKVVLHLHDFCVLHLHDLCVLRLHVLCVLHLHAFLPPHPADIYSRHPVCTVFSLRIETILPQMPQRRQA